MVGTLVYNLLSDRKINKTYHSTRTKILKNKFKDKPKIVQTFYVMNNEKYTSMLNDFKNSSEQSNFNLMV